MPKFKIETSFFEPIIIELEGGKVFESVPLSKPVTEEIGLIADKMVAGTIPELTAMVQQFSIIFGVDAAEAEKIDLRIIRKALTIATGVMTDQRKENEKLPVSEAKDLKNAPMPGPEASQ
jgi:hypothetical protein